MDKELLEDLFALPDRELWPRLLHWVWSVCSTPIPTGQALAATAERERRIAPLDNLLSGSAWELWDSFATDAPRTSQALAEFWTSRPAGKAILVLDALSLREVPWFLGQAARRGFTLHTARATASEIPADTTPFARALGFTQRSALAHNGAASVSFPGARCETTDLPFADCLGLIANEPDLLFWHAWPDDRLHDLAELGNGYALLAAEAERQLGSDNFWALVERLATGRRVVITSDHGYAHTGVFPDVGDAEQAQALKEIFKSGRGAPGALAEPHPWLPPLLRTLTSVHGAWQLVLGRKKWKSQGGYPTLAHGGLSLLEVAVPFIELSK